MTAPPPLCRTARAGYAHGATAGVSGVRDWGARKAGREQQVCW